MKKLFITLTSIGAITITGITAPLIVVSFNQGDSRWNQIILDFHTT